MGGKAFAQPPYSLRTPRLPTPLYECLKSHLHACLSRHFQHVDTPIPAPEKDTHGDIDIFVALPRDTFRRLTPEKLMAVIGATHRWKKSYAVRLSDEDAREVSSLKFVGGDGNGKLEEVGKVLQTEEDDVGVLHAQVDLTVCDSLEIFKWHLFHHSHGDLWNLLGTTIRPYGLTVNDNGLNVRVPEIEEHNRPRSLIFLTSEPPDLLAFLGYGWENDGVTGGEKRLLDEEFETWEAMYRFVSQCRFFRKETYETIMDWQGEGKLRSNDRKRMAQRNGFRVFVTEWVPSLAKEFDNKFNIQDKVALTREDVLKEALDLFGKRGEFATKVEEWRRDIADRKLKQVGRAIRMAEIAESEMYSAAWIEWIGGAD